MNIDFVHVIDKSILMERLVTDYVFQCSTRNGARALAEASDGKLFEN